MKSFDREKQTYETKRKLQFFHSFEFFYLRETQRKTHQENEWNGLRKAERFTFYLVGQIPLIGNVRMVHGVRLEPLQPSTLHGGGGSGKRLFDFSICIFFSLHISLFARFTVELIPWMFRHSILNIVVYRITMLYELKHSRRETTHCFSHIMHIAHKHIEMHNTNTFVRLQVSFVGGLEYNFRISHFERLEIRVYFPCPLDAV